MENVAHLWEPSLLGDCCRAARSTFRAATLRSHKKRPWGALLQKIADDRAPTNSTGQRERHDLCAKRERNATRVGVPQAARRV